MATAICWCVILDWFCWTNR